MKKKKSQLFTYAEIVRNNPQIFSKAHPRLHNENTNHYICKTYLGNMIKKFYHYEVEFEYDGLPVLSTSMGDRKYQPDIWVSDTDHKNKIIYLGIVEIDGLIHSASKHQLCKTRLRRESITEYFKTTYSDRAYPDYDIIFSYTIFEPDDFLYNKIDYFLETFENNFKQAKHHRHDLYL